MPLTIEIIEDSIDDTATASGVLEVTHHLQSQSHLPETAFYYVCGTNHFADVLGELKDRYQAVEVLLQAVDRFRNLILPSFLPPYTAMI